MLAFFWLLFGECRASSHTAWLLVWHGKASARPGLALRFLWLAVPEKVQKTCILFIYLLLFFSSAVFLKISVVFVYLIPLHTLTVIKALHT